MRRDDPTPKTLLLTANDTARTGALLANAKHVEALPFDGVVINVPASWQLMGPGVRLERAELRRWLEPLEGLNARMEDNFLLAVVDRPGGLFDDAAWAGAVRNWRLLAEEAERAGFRGVFFDNEEYFGRWQDFQGAPGRLEEHREQAALRGRQVMEAVDGGFPDAEVIVAHGPYLSVPSGPRAPTAIEAQAGSWEEQELRGPFFTGMAEGAGPRQALVDGGELYQLRTAGEFETSQRYRSDALPKRIDWALPDALRQGWDARIDQAHMVYTDEFPEGFAQSPRSFAAAFANALRHSEGYAVVYSELDQIDWLTAGRPPARWAAAVEDAQREAGAATSEALRVAAARPSETFAVGPGEALVVAGFDVDEGGERTHDTLVFRGEGRRATTVREVEALAAWLAEDESARTGAWIDGTDLRLIAPRAEAVLEDTVGRSGLTEDGLLDAGALLL